VEDSATCGSGSACAIGSADSVCALPRATSSNSQSVKLDSKKKEGKSLRTDT